MEDKSMMKKAMLLAVSALAAMAVSAPASALAAWNDAGVPLAANTNVEFKGTASFTSFAGGISCSTGFAKVTLEPGTTGKVTAFGATEATTKCTTSGLLAGCKV